MRHLNTLIVFLFLSFTGEVFCQTLTVEIEQKEGIYIIYPGQKPTFEYEYVKSIDAGAIIKNWRASTLVDKLLKRLKKDGIEADALIFTEDDLFKADVVNFKDSKPNKVTVEIEQKQGVYLIYPEQKSTFEYDYVKTINAGVFIKNWRVSTLVDKLLKVFTKEEIQADALIFTEDDLFKADAIKLKK
jgi:hypothetical protein